MCLWGGMGGGGVGGGLSGRYLSCLEVGLSVSGYSLLLLFYVFFFQF